MRVMIEVELKVRADHAQVRRALQRLGAQPLGVEWDEDLYFNAPHRDFRQSDEALRIRVRGRGGILTYKGPKLDPSSKTREELEVEVRDWQRLRDILLKLGFGEVAWVRKRRERFRVDPFVVALDLVEGLGEFVEVEAESDGPFEDLLTRAKELLRSLGLPQETIRRSYLELLLEREQPENI